MSECDISAIGSMESFFCPSCSPLIGDTDIKATESMFCYITKTGLKLHMNRAIRIYFPDILLALF